MKCWCKDYILRCLLVIHQHINLPSMEAISSFTVSTAQLLKELKHLSKVARAAKRKDCTLEVTITDGFIKLVIPGAHLTLAAATVGSAKFTVSLAYLTKLIELERDKVLTFNLSENLVRIKGFSFKAPTTFFETDAILRSINLPVNYTYQDLAGLLLSGKYTPGELRFNSLQEQTEYAMKQVETDIDVIFKIARNYGITRKEVKELLCSKLKLA